MSVILCPKETSTTFKSNKIPFRAAGEIPMPQAFFNSAVHWGQRVAWMGMDEKQ